MAELKTRILVVDDDQRLRELLVRYLGGEGYEVKAVPDGAGMDKQLARERYDLIVLDLMLPGEDGLAICRRLRGQANAPTIIMLTAKGDDVDRIVGLELGADDYVPKPCTPRELVARLRAILRRAQPSVDGGPLEVGPLVLWPEKRRVEWRAREVHLTSIEFNVLEVLMRNAGRVVGKHEISEQALGRPLARFDRSIDVHLSSIRQKLGEGGKLIRTVRGLGYHLVRE
jgi:DNA-binding response OmpR family regulator